MSNKKCERLCFWITGEDFTRTVRDIWLSDRPGHALKVCIEGLVGCPVGIAIDILTGKQKLTGDSRQGGLENVPDSDNLPSANDMKQRIQTKLLNKGVSVQTSFNYLHTDLFDRGYLRTLRTGNVGVEIAKERASICRNIEKQIAEYNKIREDFLYFMETYEGDKFNLADFNSFYPEIFSANQLARSISGIMKETEESIIEIENSSGKTSFSYPERDNIHRKQQQFLSASGINATPEEMLNDRLEADKQWKEIEANNCRPVSVTDKQWRSGYIDRQGRFYPCPSLEHKNLAVMLQENELIPDNIEDQEKWCDDNGYIKISINRIFYAGRNKPTKQQYEAVYRYFEARSIDKVSINGVTDNLINIEDVLCKGGM